MRIPMQRYFLGDKVLVKAPGFKYSGEIGTVYRVENTEVGPVYGVQFAYGSSSYCEGNLWRVSECCSDDLVALVRQRDGRLYAYWSHYGFEIGDYVLVSGMASGTPWKIERQAPLCELQRSGDVPKYFRPKHAVIAKVTFPWED